MAILRLANGTDLTVTLSVDEAIAALAAGAGDGFVQLPGEDGAVHLRPAGVIAVIDEPRRQPPGFRFGPG